MRKGILVACFLSLVLGANAVSIKRVEPLSWWTDMKCPLTLMFYGEDLQDSKVTVSKIENRKVIASTNGMVVSGQHNAESGNYLFVDMQVNAPGKYRITLTKGRKKAQIDYIIGEKRKESKTSFSNEDVVYLIMSDRFADGDSTNNATSNTIEKGDKSNVHGRWGGDIQGITDKLDYIKHLGATAIWPTPLLLDNEAAWSYHGYACGDYYHIDPRFGSNESYKQMVSTAHAKGIKVIMDVVTNHCGAAHWWMNDLPYSDWIHQFHAADNSLVYQQTNNAFTTVYDPNASDYDRRINESGWFDTHMPDMNLDHPDVLHYYKQWAIWWIEYAGLDGLRVDTYPYNEQQPMSEWCTAIREEYPWINIVGECWTTPASAVAYWQENARNADGFNSNLPTVMDFPLSDAIRAALADDGNYWGGGMTKVYDALARDGEYADVNRLLIFAGNHDMDRLADVVKDNDVRRLKLAHLLVSTLRGIPEIFAGDEYGQRSCDMSLGHSGLRRPLAAEDEWTEDQKELYEYVTQLLTWRRNESVIHNGKTMHFLARDNTYAYFRYNEKEAVFVFVNASSEAKVIPTGHYQEILSRYSSIGKEIRTGNSIDMSRTDIKVQSLDALVVKIEK